MRLSSIQILRAVAALFVTIYHIRAIEGLSISESRWVLEQGMAAEPGLVAGLWGNGFVGVDLFFAISGFIMVYVTRDMVRSGRSVLSFLFARAGRIYPIWWLFASVMVVYFLFAYGAPVDAQQAAVSDQSQAMHLLKSYLLQPQSVVPVLGVGWTLVHEMYFYVAFAGALMLPRRWLVVFLAVWAVSVVAGSLAGLSGPFATDYLALIFYPMTMEFILGACVGLLIVSGRIWRPGLVLVIGTVWLLGVMHFVLPPEDGTSEWAAFILQWGRVLIFGLPCALLVYALAGLDVTGRVASLGPRVSKFLQTRLAAVGDWSYSLYLCHMLVLSALRRLFPMAANFGETSLGLPAPMMDLLRLGRPGIADNVIFLVVGLAATLLVSGLAYRFFERPLANRFGAWRRRMFA